MGFHIGLRLLALGLHLGLRRRAFVGLLKNEFVLPLRYDNCLVFFLRDFWLLGLIRIVKDVRDRGQHQNQQMRGEADQDGNLQRPFQPRIIQTVQQVDSQRCKCRQNQKAAPHPRATDQSEYRSTGNST